MSKGTRTPYLPEFRQGDRSTGTFTFNPQTLSISRLTDAFAGMLGYLPEDLAALTLSGIWPDGAEREEFCRLLDGKNAVADYPADLLCRDGTRLPVTIAASAFPDTDVTCIVSSRKQTVELQQI
jgi:hypothetical protein